ncbi:hypothetical protein tb265_33210 [Gemmatimonadetes bacterium T265]|nr:hypothetical protein tb265_33210 [Gemmatimonadetes bacterium T265]
MDVACHPERSEGSLSGEGSLSEATKTAEPGFEAVSSQGERSLAALGMTTAARGAADLALFPYPATRPIRRNFSRRRRTSFSGL